MKEDTSMYCILIAGMPATGKTSFARWLGNEWKLPYLSKDSVKEILFDEVGFQSRAEKVALGVAAMKILYYFAESQMMAGKPFILENNFEDSSVEGIAGLIKKYEYKPVTVMFDGDIEVICQRFIERDRQPERHRGHVVNTAYPETGSPAPYIPVQLEAFQEGMKKRGYRRFSVGGSVIPVDCTDFSQVDYDAVARKVKKEVDKVNYGW